MNLAIAAVAIGLFGIGVAKPRPAVMGAVILAVFEGVLRKWVFPEYGQSIYFLKDIVLLGVYVRIGAERLRRREAIVPQHSANIVLALLCMVGLVELANPYLPNIFVGLFGLKAYLMYVPLLYVVPTVFPDVRSVKRFWWVFLILSTVPMVLGIVQFSSPADSVLNRYASEDELAPGSAVATFGHAGKARITGTFSYITGYAAYLLLVALMGFSLALETRGRVRMASLGLVGLALLNLLMTGSRGPMLQLALALPILVLLTLGRGGVRNFSATVWFCVAIPLIGVVIERAFPEVPAAFLQRVSGTDDAEERILGTVEGPLWMLTQAGLWGYGIGSTHQATSYLIAPGEGASLPPPVEGEWERIILEIGPLGFALVVVSRLLVAARLWTAVSQHSELRPFLAGAFLYTLFSVPANLVFNHTAAILYWFLAGLALIPGGSRERAYRGRPIGRRTRPVR